MMYISFLVSKILRLFIAISLVWLLVTYPMFPTYPDPPNPVTVVAGISAVIAGIIFSLLACISSQFSIFGIVRYIGTLRGIPGCFGLVVLYILLSVGLALVLAKLPVLPPYPNQLKLINVLATTAVLLSGTVISVIGFFGYWSGDKSFEDIGMGRSGLGYGSFGLVVVLYVLRGLLR